MSDKRVRRRDAERQRELADARAQLIQRLRHAVGDGLDAPGAQEILDQARAWVPVAARELAQHFEAHPMRSPLRPGTAPPPSYGCCGASPPPGTATQSRSSTAHAAVGPTRCWNG